jgi:hypothetical protein
MNILNAAFRKSVARCVYVLLQLPRGKATNQICMTSDAVLGKTQFRSFHHYNVRVTFASCRGGAVVLQLPDAVGRHSAVSGPFGLRKMMYGLTSLKRDLTLASMDVGSVSVGS